MTPTPERDRTSGPVLGVDIGGTNIKWVLWTGGETADAGSLPTPRGGPAAVVAALSELADPGTVTALGVAIPGHLSRDRRSTTVIPNLAGDWDGYPMADRLQRSTGITAVLLNDARAFARAELALGAARGRSEAIFVTMGTGIGGAVAVNGELVRGPGDTLGEIGHVTAVTDGVPCGCGARGCLETLAGGRALADAWSAQTSTDATAGVLPLVEAARLGDAAAQRILDQAGHAMGTVLGSVLALLGQRTVVVGGGAAPAFAFMRNAAAQVLLPRHDLIGEVELLSAGLGSQAGAIGAALQAAAPTEPHRLTTSSSRR
ncbi:ROK family protein [Streptomyces sp. NPDC059837]|uniref:ROK family protein n=1 Tax=unclassified Streptomyces TaxID=2593676 RepID=UPI003657F4EE